MKLINVGIANLCVSDKLKESYFNDTLVNESKEIANEFLKTVKNSPLLTLEFKIMNNIENKFIDNDLAAMRYIDNNIKLFETFTVDEVNSEHEKLMSFINENVILNENKVNLYNAISNLILESITDYENIDIDQIHESFTLVLNHIKKEKNTQTTIVENLNTDEINNDIIGIAINKFNVKYSNIDEEDKSLMKKLFTYDFNNKMKLFEDYKLNAINSLNNLDKEKYGHKIPLATNKLNEMVNNEETIDDNIIKVHELIKNIL